MKNLATLFLTLFLFIGLGSNVIFAQGSAGDERAWSRIVVEPNNYIKAGKNTNWVPADPNPRYFDISTGIIVGPNFRPKPGSNTTQSEMSVDVHPTNSNIVFGSANSTNWPVTTLWGTGVYWTLDGGANWTGFDNPPFGTNGGDPASAIGPDGRFYEAYLTNSYALGVATSTNNGTNWTTHIAYSTSNQDKEHIMVDKTPTSPFVNRVYLPWSDLNQSNAALVYSTDFGVTWSAYKNLSAGLGGSFYQGPNVQTAANGNVYVCYAIYDADWQDGEDAIGFSKSTDGGASWTAIRAYNHTNFGIRGYLTSKNSIRVNSFPSMAVDRSGGPNNGNIYICWPQRGLAPAGSDPDIVLIKSTDGGATWSTGIRVNDDPLNNGKDQYFPWCTVDQSTGQLILVFYDSRDVPNNQANVYMARSLDGGNTFENFKVSDQPHTPAPISGLAGGYAGDYIGVAALDDIAYPLWMDNRTGNYQGWMAVVNFGPPCPIDPPSNPNPANGATGIPFNISNISWTNGVGATQTEVWFGEAGSMVQVYSGTPITTWSIPGPLSYSKMYNWRIISKNDTCSVSGSLWAFTTEQDPNLVIDSVFVYPQNSNYWTGTCNSSSKTQVSLVNAVGNDVGWMAFDVSPIVNDPSTVIEEITFYGYLYNNDWPYWSITPMGTVNPVTAGASTINNQVSNNYQQGVAYSYNQESGTLNNGWLSRVLENTATTDLQNQLAAGWFAIGIVDFDFYSSYYIDFQGWAEANKPYLKVVYSYIIANTFQLSVNVANGWNMVSVPGLHPVNQNVNTWWQYRDTGADVFKYAGGYQSVTTATPGLGYWMKHSGARVYNTGDEWPASGIQKVPHNPLTATTGWNLIGGYELSVGTGGLSTNPPGLISGPVYKYSGGYQVATTLDPGYGYWIKLTGAGQIIIPETLPKGTEPVEYFPEGWGKIVLTDAAGVNYTLYAVKGEVDLSQYELPPAPPTGMFDIRFESGRIAEDINSSVQTIDMCGITYPVTVRVEGMDIRLMDETGKTVNVNLKSGESVVISDGTIQKLMVSGEMIPAEYALEQNYPNPFNPSTTIEFSLPENVNSVKLSIYNVLGEKVAELVNTALVAGRYSYQWNASNIATGMYIYELRTDKFVSVKKMVLMK
jgi:hypothetical protein